MISIGHHGGKVRQDRKNDPGEWRGITYSAKDNGQQIIGGDLTLGDVIVLMFDLNDELDMLGSPN